LKPIYDKANLRVLSYDSCVALVKVTVGDFQKKVGEPYRRLVEGIVVSEFPELSRLFEELRVLVGNNDDVENGLFAKQERRFLGDTKLVSITKERFSLRNWANPPRAIIELNLSVFSLYPEWKQKHSIRHECCHLLNFEITPAVVTELLETYRENYVNAFVRFKHEFCAHSCIIQRYPDDWLIEPVGFPRTMPSPKLLYSKTKAQMGTKAAAEVSIQNIVHLLSILYLYGTLPERLKSKVKKKRKMAIRYLGDFYQSVKKDMLVNLPSPEEWLFPKDFLSTEVYFDKIKRLLRLVPQ
jgi:hypothetical protein